MQKGEDNFLKIRKIFLKQVFFLKTSFEGFAVLISIFLGDAQMSNMSTHVFSIGSTPWNDVEQVSMQPANSLRIRKQHFCQ